MILSHKYKFIFFKPVKTAGTSTEECIRKLRPLGDSDIYTGLTHEADNQGKQSFAQNNHIPAGEIQEHTPPSVAKQLFPSEFALYEHYSMIRNPYDVMVSYYWYCYNHKGRTPPLKDLCSPIPGEPFEETKRKFRSFLTVPNQYAILYHHRKYQPILPSVAVGMVNDEAALVENIVRFEYLEPDLRTLFAYDNSFPLSTFKSQFRSNKRHYSEYYDNSNELKEIVRRSFPKTFERFEYSAEPV